MELHLTPEQQAAALGTATIGRRMGASNEEIRRALAVLGLAAPRSGVPLVQKCGHDMSERVRDQVHRGSHCRKCQNEKRRVQKARVRAASKG